MFNQSLLKNEASLYLVDFNKKEVVQKITENNDSAEFSDSKVHSTIFSTPSIPESTLTTDKVSPDTVTLQKNTDFTTPIPTSITSLPKTKDFKSQDQSSIQPNTIPSIPSYIFYLFVGLSVSFADNSKQILFPVIFTFKNIFKILLSAILLSTPILTSYLIIHFVFQKPLNINQLYISYPLFYLSSSLLILCFLISTKGLVKAFKNTLDFLVLKGQKSFS